MSSIRIITKSLASLLFVFFFSFKCNPNSYNTNNFKDFQGKITAIKDGDTFKVLYDGSEKTIRLAHIDCPEKKQPFGTRAKWFASQLCFGKIVIVKTEGKTDRYNRIIGEIILQDGTNVNKELVKNGFAWHFKKYSKNMEYANLEISAKEKKIGLWQEENPIAPWEWRKLRKKRSH